MDGFGGVGDAVAAMPDWKDAGVILETQIGEDRPGPSCLLDNAEGGRPILAAISSRSSAAGSAISALIAARAAASSDSVRQPMTVGNTKIDTNIAIFRIIGDILRVVSVA